MLNKRSFLFKFSVIQLILVFTITGITYAQPECNYKLSPPLVCRQNPVTPESDAFRQNIIDDINFRILLFAISTHFLRDGGTRSTLVAALNGWFEKTPYVLKNTKQIVDIRDESSIYEENGIVYVHFEKDGRKGVSAICERRRGEMYRLSDPRWEIGDRYAIFIEREKEAKGQRDLKGANAAETDPLIVDLIRKGRVAEVYLVKENNEWRLRASRVKWVKGYVPMITPPDLYRGQEIPVEQLFTGAERRRLTQWMREHHARGSPVKFRIILDSAGLEWKQDIDESNVAHAAIRDSAIYIGALLLKRILQDGRQNRRLRTEILDNDEYRHVLGLGHGSDAENQARLEMTGKTVAEDRLEDIRRAMLGGDARFLHDELRRRLRQPSKLLDMLSAVNCISISLLLYPVENRYPIKKAVALLDRDEQNKLLRILTDAKAADYRDMVVVDEILLMLDKTTRPEDWTKKHAPELEGRTLWQISPEIWHEAGGLARVMQYHGAGIHELLNGFGRLRQVEPHYQWKIDPRGEAIPLDYSRDLTHSVSRLKEADRFTVEIGGKKVTVVVSTGVNDLDIEVVLIRDVQEDGGSFYTHSLYNYRKDSGENNPKLPTWEEFSVFYSKAALEFVRREENKAKKRAEKHKQEWKAPVLHLNDSQMALISVYRKILLDEETTRSETEPGFTVDPVLEEAAIFFTTHTYGNRKEYSLDHYRREGQDRRRVADDVLDFMEIPARYRELFRNHKKGRYFYDMASAGLRSSDGQGAVARAHRDDVAIWDEWINDPDNPVAVRLKEELDASDLEVVLTAIANGDHREATAGPFRVIMRDDKIVGAAADVEHPTPRQIYATKCEAKKRLSLSGKRKKICYTSDRGLIEKGEDEDLVIALDPELPVVSYSGRLVPEKAGRSRALSDHNIEELLRRGVQVVIYGNHQTNNDLSDRLRDGLIALTERLRGKGYPGRLIFVPDFLLADQRSLLAASDMGVHDSNPSTEAAGFTEADDAVCGGIVVAPPRLGEYYNNGVGEGLFQAQGLPFNFDVTGEGNTLVPERLDAEAYLEIMLRALSMGRETPDHEVTADELKETLRDQLSHYQVQSVKLSRILEARLTAAEYLRQFSYAAANRARREKARRIMEKEREMEESSRSLFNQVFTPDREESPREHAVYQISKLAVNGRTKEAVDLFFSTAEFQDSRENLDAVAEIFNNLMIAHANDRETFDNIEAFLATVRTIITELSDDEEVSRDVQLMSGQALTIISWVRRGVTGAEGIRLTADTERMAGNEKRGNSFIDADTLPGQRSGSETQEVIAEVKEEGQPGFFWRGIEGIKKLGKNILELFAFAKKRLDSVRGNFVQYLMDHGFIRVPEGIRTETEQKVVSTIHETYFVNDMLPGSFQTTSTGAGHFQGNKLDIKYVTEGSGIQVNVKYDEDGNIVEIIAQEVKEGDWCLALPGYVDYMINLGGLRFNDMSVALTNEQAAVFNPDFGSMTAERLAVLEAVTKEKAEYAPYLGVALEGWTTAVKARSDFPDAVCVETINSSQGIFDGKSLTEVYTGLQDMRDLLSKVAELGRHYSYSLDEARRENRTLHAVSLAEANAQLEENEEQVKELPSLKKTGGTLTYIDDNETFLAETLGPLSKEDKLIRISVETIEAIGADNLRDFLAAFQQTTHGYVELFSADHPGEVEDKYGIITKVLPEGFTRSRTNTVTVFPVLKGEELPTSGDRNKRWKDKLGGESIENTVITPVGFNYDRSGLVRSIFLGLRLLEIASNEKYTPESEFVSYTLAQYKGLCFSKGQDPNDFDLTGEDLINIARGISAEETINSLNKLIRLLPIMPVNVEELRMIYEHAREALIRA